MIRYPDLARHSTLKKYVQEKEKKGNEGNEKSRKQLEDAAAVRGTANPPFQWRQDANKAQTLRERERGEREVRRETGRQILQPECVHAIHHPVLQARHKKTTGMECVTNRSYGKHEKANKKDASRIVSRRKMHLPTPTKNPERIPNNIRDQRNSHTIKNIGDK